MEFILGFLIGVITILTLLSYSGKIVKVNGSISSKLFVEYEDKVYKLEEL